jgi:hypothetical protein
LSAAQAEVEKRERSLREQEATLRAAKEDCANTAAELERRLEAHQQTSAVHDAAVRGFQALRESTEAELRQREQKVQQREGDLKAREEQLAKNEEAHRVRKAKLAEAMT